MFKNVIWHTSLLVSPNQHDESNRKQFSILSKCAGGRRVHAGRSLDAIGRRGRGGAWHQIGSRRTDISTLREKKATQRSQTQNEQQLRYEEEIKMIYIKVIIISYGSICSSPWEHGDFKNNNRNKRQNQTSRERKERKKAIKRNSGDVRTPISAGASHRTREHAGVPCAAALRGAALACTVNGIKGNADLMIILLQSRERTNHKAAICSFFDLI